METMSEDILQGLQVYMVGGAVRDELLGLPVKDRDWVVVGSTAEEMRRRGFRQVGKDFPVFLHPRTHEEYALARTERKTAPGYHGFEVHADPDVTLEQDLERRDLTINAMARGPDGELIDPFGGEDDLRQGLLRHVSPAFAEDPVRILRLARFAARFARWGFRVAHGTNALMKKMVRDGEADHLVPERIWQELERALGEDRPRRFFEVLRACGALARVLPEIDALFGIPQPERYHGEKDTGIHCLMVLDQAAALGGDTAVRFAALTHDLGKAATPAHILPSHHGHEERSARLVEGLCRRLHAPRRFRELAVLSARYHSHCHRAFELRSSTVVDTLMALDALRRPHRFADFLLVCKADSRGRLGQESNPYRQAAFMAAAREAIATVEAGPLAATGLSGAALGEALRKARIEAVDRLRAAFH